MIPRPRKAIARAKAIDVHRTLRIEQPDEIDVERIACYHDVLVEDADLTGMDGCIVRKDASAIISVRCGIRQEGQRRFVIAHELGHFFLHPGVCQLAMDSGENFADWSEKNVQEHEANLFAAELLMPRRMFEPMLVGKEPSFNLVEDLKDEFNTGLFSTAFQMVSVTKEECALVCSSNRNWLWAVTSPNFGFKLLRDRTIHGCSLANQSAKLGRRLRSTVDAGYWLEGYYDDHKSKITEESECFGNINLTLTLLWIHDAI